MTKRTNAESVIEQYLGDHAEDLLGFASPRISRNRLHLPGPDFVDRVFANSDRNPRVLVSLQRLFDRGRLSGTGYLSILPVDQGVEHSYHTAADLTGQANHLGATIEADIVKQKLPDGNGGYEVLNGGQTRYGKFDKRMYTELASEHPIDLCRYQVANGYMGRAGLINSGGASGANDFAEAVTTAVINKRAGGMGLISGRKAFQRPMDEGVRLLHAIQDVYLSPAVTIA